MEINKGKIFYFPKLSDKNYFIFIFVLCSLFRRFFPFLIESFDFGKVEKENFNKSCLFDMLSNFTGDFLTGSYKLYLFITNNKNKKKKNIKNDNKLIEDEGSENTNPNINKINEIKSQKEIRKKNFKSTFFLIFSLISIVDIIAQYCLLFFSYYDIYGCAIGFSSICNKEKINEDDLIFTVPINIFFRYIFSYFLLTIYIRRHHKLSIYITIISFIPLIILNIISIKKANEILYIFLNIFMTILYAFEDVLNKVALNNLIISPYEVIFYKSLFQLPLFIFTIILVSLLDKNLPKNNTISLSDYIIKNESKIFGRLIYRLSFIICSIFRTLSLMIVTQILSPNHLSILKSFEFVVLFIFSVIKNIIYKEKLDKNEIVLYSIGLICCIFLLVASLIHNEIIIINRCNLSKETDFKNSDEDEKKIEDDLNYIKIIKDDKNNNDNDELNRRGNNNGDNNEDISNNRIKDNNKIEMNKEDNLFPNDDSMDN